MIEARIDDRREFLRRLSLLAGSVAAANALLPLFENNYARAAIVQRMIPVSSRRV